MFNFMGSSVARSGYLDVTASGTSFCFGVPADLLGTRRPSKEAACATIWAPNQMSYLLARCNTELDRNKQRAMLRWARQWRTSSGEMPRRICRYTAANRFLYLFNFCNPVPTLPNPIVCGQLGLHTRCFRGLCKQRRILQSGETTLALRVSTDRQYLDASDRFHL